MDDDLRLLAERMMKWTERAGWWIDPDDDGIMYSVGQRMHHEIPVWNPRTNWAHAGMLVERLAEMGSQLHVYISKYAGRPPSWYAHFEWWTGDKLIVYDGEGTSGPAAITEAALALARELSESEGE